MGGAVIDGEGGIVEFHEAVDEAGGETVASADAVENLQAVPLDGLVEFAVCPKNCAPVVDGCGFDGAERRRDGFEIRIGRDDLLDHFLEAFDGKRRELFVCSRDFEAQTGREVLFISEHDIDVLGDFAVDFLRTFFSADGLPQRRTVIQVVTRHCAILFCGFKCFDHNAWRRVGKGGENAARMEPADAELTEDIIPVDVARLQLRRGGVAAVRAADGTADAEAAFREVETIADGAADAVERNPFDERRIDAALHDEIFDETTDGIVGKGGHDGGAFAEAFAEAAGDVVFAAAFPDVEGARRVDAAFAWIEAEHDFTEGDDIVAAGFGGFCFHDGRWIWWNVLCLQIKMVNCGSRIVLLREDEFNVALKG